MVTVAACSVVLALASTDTPKLWFAPATSAAPEVVPVPMAKDASKSIVSPVPAGNEGVKS